MSWHARWGSTDPFARPTKVGERFGVFEVVDVSPKSDPHYGLRAEVRCTRCERRYVRVVAKLRYYPSVQGCIHCRRRVTV